jgi:hypothetical protein
MSVDFNDTTDCPICGNENAYYNGLNYECPDCGYEWGDESDEEDYLDEQEQKELRLKKQEIQYVQNGITITSLRKLYSPDWLFYKWDELYAEHEHGLEEDYWELVFETIATQNDFSQVRNIEYSKELDEKKKKAIEQRVIKSYLESRDELPLFPTVNDWACYIKAPIEFINQIIPNGHVDFWQFMPLAQMNHDAFATLFNKKLSELYQTMKSGNDELSEEISMKDVEYVFTCIVNDEKPAYPVLDWIIGDKIRKEFSKELTIIKTYREELNSKKCFEKYILQAKDKNMSLLETIVFILQDYLKEILS